MSEINETMENQNLENVEKMINDTPEMKDMVEEAVNSSDVYASNEDVSIPDFDADLIRKNIEEASYVELPLWKKKIFAYQKNLEEVRQYLESFNLVAQYLEKNPSAELSFINEMKNKGIDPKMEMQSFVSKYEVNKAFLEEILKRIDERLTNERDEIVNSVTSVKSAMFLNVLTKNLEEAQSKNHPNAPKLRKYIETMIEVYENRTDLFWVDDLIETGTNIRAIYSNFKRIRKNTSMLDMVRKSFNGSFVPDIDGASEEDRDFFIYFLCYISNVSNLGTVNIKARKNKEKALCVIQNLSDCNFNLFDLDLKGVHSDDLEKCKRDYLEMVRDTIFLLKDVIRTGKKIRR